MTPRATASLSLLLLSLLHLHAVSAHSNQAANLLGEDEDLLSFPRRSSTWQPTKRGTPAIGFYNASANGGGFLTFGMPTYPPGLGEPLNVVLSAWSDSDVLVDQQINGGLRNYFNAFGFSGECLGQHSGSDQEANLGDGNGGRNETAVIRWDYNDASLGTCTETVEGGNHFRYWIQNGKEADSGAVFIAASYEKPVAEQHDIIYNGYNLARDWLVGNVTNQSQIIDTSTVSNQSTFSGSVSYNGYTYYTTVQYVSGYLSNTSDGINHMYSVGANGTNAVDGLVAVMTAKITSRPAKSSAAPSVTTTASRWNLWAVSLSSLLLPLLSA